ncbi:MAG: inositol monophosphatase family protein [Alphaproteobacteria bacterium]
MADAALIDRYGFAREVARKAGARAMDWRRRASGFAPEQKEPGDWVTAADRDVEQFIRQRIAERFPGDAVLGEEEGGTIGARTWVLDPIDGTTNYVHGIPFWCVSIGVLVDGAYAIGVIEDPTHGVQFHGQAGSGAFRSEAGRRDTRLSVSTQSTLQGCRLAFAHQTKRDIEVSMEAFARAAREGATFRALGSGALHLACVAGGVLDGYFESAIHLWDIAAAALLIEEAGGWIKAPFDPDRPVAAFPVVAGTAGLQGPLEAATARLFQPDPPQ